MEHQVLKLFLANLSYILEIALAALVAFMAVLVFDKARRHPRRFSLFLVQYAGIGSVVAVSFWLVNTDMHRSMRVWMSVLSWMFFLVLGLAGEIGSRSARNVLPLPDDGTTGDDKTWPPAPTRMKN